jgi:hypothetical protein
VEDEIEREVDKIAEEQKRYNCDPFSGYDGYYRGISGDACKEERVIIPSITNSM